jgi:hypothetical protein
MPFYELFCIESLGGKFESENFQPFVVSDGQLITG